MDKAFEKLGIYDFFGIWIPGALTVTYYLFTLRDFFYHLFSHLRIEQNGLSGNFLLIILYTAIAYLVGVILHELGKIIVDKTSFMRISGINKSVTKDKQPFYLKLPNMKKIRSEYTQALIQNDIIIDDLVDFDKAISYLKYNNTINTKRIDTYHAVYALSRSLCLCFLGHSVLLTLNLIISYCHNWSIKPSGWIIVIDIVLLLLFFIRKRQMR